MTEDQEVLELWLLKRTMKRLLVWLSGSRWRWVVIVLCAILFVVFIWPTPYVYYESPGNGALIRLNRFTGEAVYVFPRLR